MHINNTRRSLSGIHRALANHKYVAISGSKLLLELESLENTAKRFKRIVLISTSAEEK